MRIVSLCDICKGRRWALFFSESHGLHVEYCEWCRAEGTPISQGWAETAAALVLREYMAYEENFECDS